MVCARDSHVKGLRPLASLLTLDGKHKSNGKWRICRSRIQVVHVKWQYLKLRGSGDHVEDSTSILNCHFNSVTAKKAVSQVRGSPKGPEKAYKQFFDKIADYTVEYKCRIIAGDLNMAFFALIPELRARGFQITLAGWHCCQFERFR